MGKLDIKLEGVSLEVSSGVTVYDILKDCYSGNIYDVLLVKVNGRLKELSYIIEEDCDIKVITAKDKAGMKTYERGISFVFLKAIDELYKDEIEHARLEYGLGRAVYCDIDGKTVSEEDVLSIKAKMKSIIDENLPIIKSTISTKKAIELFEKNKNEDKAKLFKYRRASKTNIYELDGYIDYFYGYMPYSTGFTGLFDVIKYKTGVLIVFPATENPSELGTYGNSDKLFETLVDSNDWARMLGADTVGALNKRISEGDALFLILLSEARQEKKIAEIAEMIKQSGSKRFVMISGPSSSGKTTFSYRLSIQLGLIGYKPHPIALDDFYKNREDTPRDENGEYDFECLEAIDIELFNDIMTRLLNGETVDMPTFNFKTGKREYRGNKMTLGKDDILVIEGIHGINDDLSYTLPVESKFKIYISALTQINIDEHNRIPTTDGRLLRRMVRDYRTRATSARETIARWPSVRRGEEKYIFPNQENADVMFNSATLYELCAIKKYAEPLLFGIPEDCEEYEEANRLLKFLDYFLNVPDDDIPNNSLVREFIGGGVFNI